MRSAVVIAAAALAGCATGNVQIRSVPAETPAADTQAAIAAQQTLAAAKSKQAAPTAEPIVPADAPSMRTYDPWEPINRFTYRFNARFDETVFLPVSNAYRSLPAPVQGGVHNFFSNLSEVDSTINFALQARPALGLRSAGRFLINTTIGIGGLFDVAAKLNLAPASTGFATTLATWGMHPGPYLVLPFLGPSTLRDGVGYLGDFGTSYVVDIGGLYRNSSRSWMLGVGNAIDQRSNINFRYYATGSAFEYESIRFLYVRKRLIEDEALHKDEPVVREPRTPAGQ
ncbi:MAG: VacJ family lipoprotein [Rudaea sp.]